MHARDEPRGGGRTDARCRLRHPARRRQTEQDDRRVTDRGMYIALATRNRLASQLTVGEVAYGRRCSSAGRITMCKRRWRR